MLSSLALLLFWYTPQVEQKPTVTNVRPTIGALGPQRSDTNYLPGDVVHVTFDVAGLKLDDQGRYRVAPQLVIEDPAGKAIASEDYGSTPGRLGVLAGGRTRFAFRFPIPTDLASGTYKAKLQLADANSSQKTTIDQSFKVLPPG